MDDAERFRTLFESSYEPIRRYLRHRGVDFGRADDLVAETFVVAWRRLSAVPPNDPLPWLMAVARPRAVASSDRSHEPDLSTAPGIGPTDQSAT